MILFYRKDTGEVFATIDGRVHDEQHLKCFINPGIPEENIGKFIIGWEETGELDHIESVEEEVTDYILDSVDSDGEEFYRKVVSKRVVERPVYKKIEHNLDKFELLQEFEAISPTSPLDYKVDVEHGELVKIQ